MEETDTSVHPLRSLAQSFAHQGWAVKIDELFHDFLSASAQQLRVGYQGEEENRKLEPGKNANLVQVEGTVEGVIEENAI